MLKRSEERELEILHGLDIKDGRVGIDLMDGLRDLRNGSRGIPTGSRRKAHAKRLPASSAGHGNLVERKVERGGISRLVQSIELGVTHNSYDLSCRIREEAQRHVLANGIIVRPKPSGHRLANQHHGRSSGYVGVIQISSPHDWYSASHCDSPCRSGARRLPVAPT